MVIQIVLKQGGLDGLSWLEGTLCTYFDIGLPIRQQIGLFIDLQNIDHQQKFAWVLEGAREQMLANCLTIRELQRGNNCLSPTLLDERIGYIKKKISSPVISVEDWDSLNVLAETLIYLAAGSKGREKAYFAIFDPVLLALVPEARLGPCAQAVMTASYNGVGCSFMHSGASQDGGPQVFTLSTIEYWFEFAVRLYVLEVKGAAGLKIPGEDSSEFDMNASSILSAVSFRLKQIIERDPEADRGPTPKAKHLRERVNALSSAGEKITELLENNTPKGVKCLPQAKLDHNMQQTDHMKLFIEACGNILAPDVREELRQLLPSAAPAKEVKNSRWRQFADRAPVYSIKNVWWFVGTGILCAAAVLIFFIVDYRRDLGLIRAAYSKLLGGKGLNLKQ